MSETLYMEKNTRRKTEEKLPLADTQYGAMKVVVVVGGK